jgi:hypothetical protein
MVVPRPMPAAPRRYLLDRGGQAGARGSCLSQVLDRGAQAVARGAYALAKTGSKTTTKGHLVSDSE